LGAARGAAWDANISKRKSEEGRWTNLLRRRGSLCLRSGSSFLANDSLRKVSSGSGGSTSKSRQTFLAFAAVEAVFLGAALDFPASGFLTGAAFAFAAGFLVVAVFPFAAGFAAVFALGLAAAVLALGLDAALAAGLAADLAAGLAVLDAGFEFWVQKSDTSSKQWMRAYLL
jgi:hypothetical protein